MGMSCADARRKWVYLVFIVALLCSLAPVAGIGGGALIVYADAPLQEGSVLRFEDEGDSLRAAGWTRRLPPDNGVYITDAANSLGNPNGTAMKTVPTGQYLLYADQQGSALGKYTTMTKKTMIGPGAWTLRFSAKFIDLIKPSANAVYRGISFELFAAGRQYKLTLNDKNKLLLMTGSGGGYTSKEISMPEDETFHDWEFTFDGNHTITVKIDDIEVASFRHEGIPAPSRADELLILNVPLNWESGVNEVYLDRIAVYSTAQEVPAEMLIDDDASSLSAAGWSRSLAPIDGLYATDAASTLGNPNGVVMKTVPNGQYLLYGDYRASAAGKYVRLLKETPIGTGAWTLSFSARMVDLMKPSRYETDRGLTFDIFAAGRRYKLAFNDTNKVIAGTGAKVELDMPDDDDFHRWDIAYNGIDTIYLRLDGETVASFVNPSTAAAGTSDRVQIINAPLDWESGTTEVYLDDVRLYKTVLVDPNLILYDDASDFQAVPWTVDAPAADAYFTDYERTNGTVVGMTYTEQGRYLTVANGSAVSAAEMSRTTEIGGGPWALEFDAKLVSLVAPPAAGAERGFSAEVVADGKRYRLVFNDEDKLYVSQSDGSYVRVDSPLLSDTFYDTWGMAFDAAGRLIVTRNGVKLGVWANTGMPVQQPDQIVFRNDAAGAAGVTEVSLDRIRMVKHLLPSWSAFQPAIVGVSVLPESDASDITAVVSLHDADPLTFGLGGLELEASLTQGGQVVQHVYAPVNDHHVQLQLQAGAYSGWMELGLKLRRNGSVLSEAGYKLEVAPVTRLLLPSYTADAVTGHVYLYTAVDQMRDASFRTPQQAGWAVADYDYEGLSAGGSVIESVYGEPLALPVELNGWYGVYVGYVTGTEGFVVSDGASSQSIELEDATGAGYGSRAIAETFALASEFSGGTVSIAPIPGKQARIAYIRLKALSPGEAALYVKPDEGAAGKRAVYNNDGYSDYFSGRYDTEQKLLDNAVNLFENQDAHALVWALGTTMHILRDSTAAGRPYASLTQQQEEQLMRDGDRHVRDVVLGYIDDGKDPLAIVAEGARDIGMDAFASLRMSAFYNPNVYPWLNGNRYAEFADDGYLQRKSDGSADLRMSYAYAEFRQFIIDVLKEAAAVTDSLGQPLLKGVELDYCRYPNVLGFEPALTEAYELQYGIDPRQETTPSGIARWNAFKADVMTEFMEDVRSELAGMDIAVRIPHNSYLENGLDIEAWIDLGLIDQLTVCEIGHETFFDGIEQFRDMTDGTGVRLYGNINGTLSGSDLTRQEEELRKRGIRVKTGHERVDKQLFKLRAHEFYEAGYDGVYLFNSWNARAIGSQSLLGELGDKVKLEKWYAFGYPAEWVSNLITIEPQQP